ncbi:hypothetical protein H0H93_011951, partial [Arthromyces matolae]
MDPVGDMQPEQRTATYEERYHSAKAAFLQESLQYYDRLNDLSNLDDQTENNKYIETIFKELANEIVGREDLLVWPVHYLPSLHRACNPYMPENSRARAFDHLVKYIREEAAKFTMVAFFQESPKFLDEMKAAVSSGDQEKHKQSIERIFKKLANEICGREDLLVWPALYLGSLENACNPYIPEEDRVKEFDYLVKYKEAAKSPVKAVNTRSPLEASGVMDKAFRADYVGCGVTWFEEAFRIYRDMYHHERHYGKVIPILQSNGMGKSRVIAEIGKD